MMVFDGVSLLFLFGLMLGCLVEGFAQTLGEGRSRMRDSGCGMREVLGSFGGQGLFGLFGFCGLAVALLI